MKIVFQTQYLENYGVHDWNGEGDCPQYWKPKGGDTYVMPNLTEKEATEMLDNKNILSIYNLIEYKNNGAQEYIISSEVVSDDAQVCEDWQIPLMIEKLKDGYIATQITPNDEFSMFDERVKEKCFSYLMKPEGKKEKYTTFYLMKNGDVVPYDNMLKYINELNDTEKSLSTHQNNF